MLRERLAPRGRRAWGDTRGAEGREVDITHQIATVSTLYRRIGQLLRETERGGGRGEKERESKWNVNEKAGTKVGGRSERRNH